MATNGRRRSAVTALTVDDEGLLLDVTTDAPVDVLFDDQRVFSFWLRRDTSAAGDQRRVVWPPVLRRFLNGTVTVSIVDPADGTTWITTEATLGDGAGRVEVRDDKGNPLGLDKSLRLTRLFGDQDPGQMVPLLDAMQVVLDALEKAGVEPFVAYGTLLGAVRDKNFIGHDSDADLGYVSAHEHPADVIRESLQLQRRLQAMGFAIQRYSGLGFKVTVKEADGSPRGLDVFGGFMNSGVLYLMGEVGQPFERTWLYPRSEVTLAGRTFPAPAVPDHLLAAMYGPSWRVPDPAFKFTTSPGTVRRLNGWFRGTRVGFDERWKRVRSDLDPQTKQSPSSSFVRWLNRREVAAPDLLVVDVGCGQGRDVLWLARHGRRAVGLDYFPPDLRRARRVAENRGLEATFDWCNLGELRSVLATGALLAREEGPRVVMAHHVADATDRNGRAHLVRLAKMVTRDSGRFYLQAYVAATPRSRQLGLRPVDDDALVDLIESSGGRVIRHLYLSEHEAGFTGVPEDDEPTICRMAVSWSR